VKILSWNIWMMPPYTGESPRNEARAASIAIELRRRDFDIIVFQKAFDGAARKIFRHSMSDVYPHQYGPLNDDSLKLNGGVYVLSREPLSLIREIQYRDSVLFWEGFSRKGAMLLSGYADGKPFQLIGTHLQGESSSEEKSQAVRDKQIAQLAAEMVSKTDPNLPLFICGDLNIQRSDRQNPAADSPSYLRMLRLLGAVNGPGHRITLDDHSAHNDLAIDNKGREAELDYILLRRGPEPVAGTWETVRITHPGWDGDHGRKDLSYRFGVCAQLQF
jgi:endonuclease/exonuclease/phosphatase family metal-dependent hydrolase